MTSQLKYITPKEIKKNFGISSTTLRNWAQAGKINCIRPNGGRRLYSHDDISSMFNAQTIAQTLPDRKRLLYARVSSQHQVEDLQRQCTLLQTKYPSDQLIKDVASGLNWERKGFNNMLELINGDSIAEIVVAYKDRLCRFGFELFEWICQKHNTKIVILNPVASTTDRTQELAEDLFSLVTVFVAKNNGLRAAKNRQIRKENAVTETK